MKKPACWGGLLSGAKDGIRTRDPDLGKVVLYQLSYFRVGECKYTTSARFCNSPMPKKRTAPGDGSGSVQLGFRSPPRLLQHDALGGLAGFALYYYKVYATSESA
jgi:hypothetical protein